MATIKISGYEQEGHCEHCGRALKHCIKIDDGRIVGSTCFNKILTRPKLHFGKHYRVGEETIVRYAKLVELGKLERAGLTLNHITFEAN